MKRTVLSLLSAIGIAGPAAADNLNVTFINPGGSDGFWGEVSSTMTAAASDLGIDVEIIDSNRDRFAMVDAAASIAERAEKPDYVVLVNELQQGPGMYTDLRDAGVPTFFLLNRLSNEQLQEVGDTSQIAGSIAPDNEIAGYEMAMSLIEAARAAGKADDGVQILALLGDTATPAALQREAGLKRAVAEAGDAEIVRGLPVNWSADEAKKRTEQFLKRESVDAIWSANDPISFGAQEAAVAAGFSPGEDMFFAGLNWSTPALEAVNDGRMTLTHGGHFFAGAWSMVAIRDIVDGNMQSGTDIDFPMSAVTQENVGAFLNSIAAGEYSAMDFKTFSLGTTGGTSHAFTVENILDALG